MVVARPGSPRRAVPATALVALLAVISTLLLPTAAPGATSAAAAAKARAAGAAAWTSARTVGATRTVRARTARVRRTRVAIDRRAGRRSVPDWLRRLSATGARAFTAKRGGKSGGKTTPTSTSPGTTSGTGSTAAPLRFGIYPGGGAGAVGDRGEPIPEDPVKRLAALRELRGTKPFVLHLYEDYRSSADAAAIPSWLQTQVSEATRDGFQVEMVLRYRPAASGGDVAGFAEFVRARARQYGADRGVTALQITNEANITAAPDAADGWYAGARQALVQGILAADDELRRINRTDVQLGFNWAYGGTSSAERAFFTDLGRLGGAALAAATDWVGVDAYPGTWGPDLPSGDLAAAVRTHTIATMQALRDTLMPLAGLHAAAIRFAENGYPTDAQRTEAMQATVMTAAISAIDELRATYRVTDYRWFDLRDADSDYPSFESHYGITRHDYAPKAGFSRYRDLIARLG